MTKNLNKNNEKQFKTNVVARNNGQKGIGLLTAENYHEIALLEDIELFDPNQNG